MKRKHLTKFPCVLRIGSLAAIITTVFYLLALYLSAIPNTPANLFSCVYSESLIKTAHQHLLLLVGFDTLIYQKYYDTPPILVDHQDYFLAPFPGSEALLKSGIGKGNFYCKCFFYCFISLWRRLHLTLYLGLLLPLLR